MTEDDCQEALRQFNELMDANQFDEAENLGRRLSKECRKHWQVYFFLGSVLFEKQKWANTLSMFRTVLKLNERFEIPEEFLAIANEHINLAVRSDPPDAGGQPSRSGPSLKPQSPLKKKGIDFQNKLEAGVENRNQETIDVVTGPLRGEINSVRESIGRYLFVLDPEDYLKA